MNCEIVEEMNKFCSHEPVRKVIPFRDQLLKWVGNKQRVAHEIIAHFPARINTYYEPFLGSAAVLGTLEPDRGVGADVFEPLIGIWQTLKASPEVVKAWYSSRWYQMQTGQKEKVYESIRNSYNANPNPADLLFIARACYGGVVRFRQADGHISTPCGVHTPISPTSFSRRVDEWRKRIQGSIFVCADFEAVMNDAKAGDLIYCDPPYSFSQSILYGAQAFCFERLLNAIERCKCRGVYVALSIDGTKRSGRITCDIPKPTGLFEREVFINVGRSMLKRFQMNGRSLENEVVADRLLLTY